jgi:hypothetical protein
MNGWYPALLVIAAAAAVVGLLVFMDRASRQSITQNIEGNGGKVIEILKLWGEGSRSEQVYEVSYMTAQGESVRKPARSVI